MEYVISHTLCDTIPSEFLSWTVPYFYFSIHHFSSLDETRNRIFLVSGNGKRNAETFCICTLVFSIVTSFDTTLSITIPSPLSFYSYLPYNNYVTFDWHLYVLVTACLLLPLRTSKERIQSKVLGLTVLQRLSGNFSQTPGKN